MFDAARNMAVAERTAFLASACSDDPALQAAVAGLFAADSAALPLLEPQGLPGSDNATTTDVSSRQIAGYDLVAFVGAGGMGEVYKAYDRNLERHVALKLLPIHLTHNPERLRRFRAEARAASSLNHPHILVVHDFGEVDGRPFMVTEFVEGQTLRQRISVDPLPVRHATDIAAQIASALAAAHSRGVVHRDIKPENVMLRPDGFIKLLDFGLARQTDDDAATTTGTQQGVLVGTLRYMSPEQSRGQQVHAPSDVFSLGLVLFEMMTGRHPFHAGSNIGVLHGIQFGTANASGAGIELDRLLFDMLQKDALLRPSAAAVFARLTGLATEPPVVSQALRARGSVGREGERADLRTAFEAAAGGAGQIVAVAGEAGIGKSTLVGDFLSEIETPAWIGRGRCSERLAGAEAHLPFLEALESLLTRDPGVATLMKRCAPGWYVQIAPEPPDESSEAGLLATTRSGSAERLMREMAALLRELTRSRPVVLFLDDVHWADLSTLDLLGYLAPKLAVLRALIVVTYRPADLTVSRHPFLRLKSDLSAHGALRDVAVAFLTEQDVALYVAAELPDAPDGLAALVYKKTEGNPLFMADLVRYLRERGVPADWAFEIQRNIPESLRGMIERKLEGLEDEQRQLLRVAAVQGFQFDSTIVAQVLARDPADVEDALQSLELVHGLVQLLREQELPSHLFSLRYQFVHVLYQGALYASVSPSRNASWSGKVAAALEAAYAERKNNVAAELALLYEMARDPWRASEHFLAASHVASSRFATREAVAFARRGLTCVSAVPGGVEAWTRELALQKALRVPLAIVEGYGTPATEVVSQRVIALSEQLADHGSLFAALDGAFLVHMVRGECVAAAEISDRMLDVARQSGSEVQHMLARTWAMIARHHLGDLAASQRHADICIQMGTPANQGARLISILDPVVASLAESSRNFWMMGDAAACLERTRQAIVLAREIKHPDSLSFALLFHGWMHGHCGDWDTCLSSTAEAIALGNAHGLVQTMAWNHIVHGWALAHLGDAANGLVQLETGIESSTQIMGQIAMPHFIAMLAEVLVLRRDHVRALHEIERILTVNETSRDRYFNAELDRLAAGCQLALGQSGSAEARLQRAIETARVQGAVRFELRATTALAELWVDRQEKSKACALLHRVCELMRDTDIADVRRARSCLAAWS
jgi:hypothetical protein